MKLFLLKIAMFLRHGYTKVFEYFVLKKAKHTKQEIQDGKAKLKFYQDAINSISDYERQLNNLKTLYPWVSDPLRGLIDWTPSLKNLWVFFCKRTSRDCDDFSALAYYTLKEKVKDYKITEWCVLKNKKIKGSHMIVTARKQGDRTWYIFDNHNTFTSDKITAFEFDDRYKCGNLFAKYR